MASWRLKLPETRLFIQQPVHDYIQDNINAQYYWACLEVSTYAKGRERVVTSYFEEGTHHWGSKNGGCMSQLGSSTSDSSPNTQHQSGWMSIGSIECNGCWWRLFCKQMSKWLWYAQPQRRTTIQFVRFICDYTSQAQTWNDMCECMIEMIF